MKIRLTRPHFTAPLWAVGLLACGHDAELADKAALAAHHDSATWEVLDDNEPSRRLRDPRTGITFVRVPAGEFRQVYKGIERSVVVSKPFLLAETELTAAQWRSYLATANIESDLPVSSTDALPMHLSWLEADAFCTALGYRLPTEAEWERACRADHSSDGPWSTAVGAREHAWFNANAGEGPKPVATRAPNGLGLHDMLGNVWEWCSDWFGDVPYGLEPNPRDPIGPASGKGRSLRGGSWFTQGNPGPTYRTQDYPPTNTAFYGLRPARSL